MIPTELLTPAELDASDYAIDARAWAEPKRPGISGCFRLRNEAEFMVRAVESHLPALDEAVLVVQKSEDATLDLASDLAVKYPEKVRVCLYPFAVHHFGTAGYRAAPPNSVHSMVFLSNWALSRCRFAWISKSEGDVVAFPSFEASVRSAISAAGARRVFFGRIVLNLAGPDCREFSASCPRNGGWDECIVPNHPAFHFEKAEKWETLEPPPGAARVCLGWSGWHTKRCKACHSEIRDRETWQPLTPANLEAALSIYRANDAGMHPDIPVPEEAYRPEAREVKL